MRMLKLRTPFFGVWRMGGRVVGQVGSRWNLEWEMYLLCRVLVVESLRRMGRNGCRWLRLRLGVAAVVEESWDAP